VSDPKAPIPHGPALIVKKLALSHTMSVIECLKRNFNSLEYGLRKNWSDMQHVTGLEKTLTELFGWNLQLSEYCEHAEAALDGLRILQGHAPARASRNESEISTSPRRSQRIALGT
jgi:hypothetical protein